MGELARFAVANARARSLLGSLLGHRALESLYGLANLPAVVEALGHTPYGAAASEYRPIGVSMTERVAVVGRALLETLDDPERAFLRHYLLHLEVDGLEIVMRGVHRRLPWENLRRYLVPLDGVATFDVAELAGSRDLRDLIERLAGTAYHAPLAAAFHRLESAGLLALEVALQLDFYEKLWLAADGLARPDADRARRLVGTLFDVLNLCWIATYRGALGISPEEIVNYTLREGRHLDPPLRRRLAGTAPRPAIRLRSATGRNRCPSRASRSAAGRGSSPRSDRSGQDDRPRWHGRSHPRPGTGSAPVHRSRGGPVGSDRPCEGRACALLSGGAWPGRVLAASR